MLFDACKKSDDGNCGYQSSNSQGLLKEIPQGNVCYRIRFEYVGN